MVREYPPEGEQRATRPSGSPTPLSQEQSNRSAPSLSTASSAAVRRPIVHRRPQAIFRRHDAQPAAPSRPQPVQPARPASPDVQSDGDEGNEINIGPLMLDETNPSDDDAIVISDDSDVSSESGDVTPPPATKRRKRDPSPDDISPSVILRRRTQFRNIVTKHPHCMIVDSYEAEEEFIRNRQLRCECGVKRKIDRSDSDRSLAISNYEKHHSLAKYVVKP